MDLHLPVHLSQRHPLTGEPVRALWVRPDGRVMWPIMGGDETADAAAAAAKAASDAAATKAAEDAAAAKAAEDAKSDRGYPANTPIEQMTGEQREAYWKFHAHKHEERVKSFGDLTPQALAELRAKADKQDATEYELSSASEKAVADAKKATQDEADATYRPLLAETAFRVAIGERNARAAEADRKSEDDVSEFIGDLNLSRFLTDAGHVDTAKVLARVDQFAPATGTQQNQQRRGPSPTGQGNSSGNQRSAPGTGSVSAGRDLYAETHPKKAS